MSVDLLCVVLLLSQVEFGRARRDEGVRGRVKAFPEGATNDESATADLWTPKLAQSRKS